MNVAAVSAAARTAIAVLARAPVPGHAKTRLVPALGAAGAARLAERMLEHAVDQAVGAAVGPVTVWATPDAAHPAFGAAQRRHGVALAVQGAGDLGERMARVFGSAFGAPAAADAAGAPGALLLIGTDAPALDAARLRAAAGALASHPAVFVPAFDGGYALVGLHAACAPEWPALLRALFEGMRWSTPQVMAQTRRRLAAVGCAHVELAPVRDIDEPDDLKHLPPGWTAQAVQR